MSAADLRHVLSIVLYQDVPDEAIIRTAQAIVREGVTERRLWNALERIEAPLSREVRLFIAAFHQAWAAR